jgi:tripartite-type tricarboxylate transporter receptor subunit TctC
MRGAVKGNQTPAVRIGFREPAGRADGPPRRVIDVAPTHRAWPQVQAGSIRAVVQTGKSRAAALPEVATVAERGVPGFEAYAWWGIFAPAGVPSAMIERFGAEMTACLREERVARQLSETQQVSLALGGPEAQRAFLAEQMRVWGAVVRENNIKGDA